MPTDVQVLGGGRSRHGQSEGGPDEQALFNMAIFLLLSCWAAGRLACDAGRRIELLGCPEPGSARMLRSGRCPAAGSGRGRPRR